MGTEKGLIMAAKAKKENRLVVGSSSWAESLPDWLLDEIRSERMILGLVSIAGTLTNSEKVGNAETIAYLMTASQRAPLPHNLIEVYLYLTTKVMKRRDTVVPDDIRKTELSRDEERELQELKSMIYSKRGGDIQHPVLDAMRQLKKEVHKKKPITEKTLFEQIYEKVEE